MGHALIDPDLRFCWPPKDANWNSFWDQRTRHNDLGYGEALEGLINIAQEDWELMKRLDARLECEFALPHRYTGQIAEIAKLNLGIIPPAAWAHNSPLVEMRPYEPFNQITQSRKSFSGSCCPLEKSDLARHECTLKSRFLVRWICLRCHLEDWSRNQDFQSHFTSPPDRFNEELEEHWRDGDDNGWTADAVEIYAEPLKCVCGKVTEIGDTEKDVVLCSWCWGRVEDNTVASFNGLLR